MKFQLFLAMFFHAKGGRNDCINIIKESIKWVEVLKQQYKTKHKIEFIMEKSMKEKKFHEK